MKFIPHEIFEKYPDIEDIAIRLEQSETEAKEKNSKTEPSTESNKRIFIHTPEHAVISRYYKGGRWEQSPFVPKPGRKPFLDDLAKILETRKPDAIKVEIFKGKTEKSGVVYSKELYFNSEPEIKNEQEQLGAFEKKLDEKLEQFRQEPGTNNLQIELLRKDFQSQLAEQKHNSEIRELNLRHQAEISALQTAISQRDEYIRELESELDENEGTLGSLKAEAEKEKATPFGEILLGRVLAQAGENILKNNPKILKVGLGLSDADVKRIFEREGTKELAGAKAEDNSGFSECAVDDLSNLDEKHAQGIKDLIGFFKQIPVEEFKKLYTIDCMLQDGGTGMLNAELADKTLSFINENKTK